MGIGEQMTLCYACVGLSMFGVLVLFVVFGARSFAGAGMGVDDVRDVEYIESGEG